jgi:hypothetical protein
VTPSVAVRAPFFFGALKTLVALSLAPKANRETACDGDQELKIIPVHCHIQQMGYIFKNLIFIFCLNDKLTHPRPCIAKIGIAGGLKLIPHYHSCRTYVTRQE